jgi:hypothetical protein
VLHPQHKLQYFKNANWEQEWIEAAKLIVWTEFKCSYEKSSHTEGGEDGDEQVDDLVCLCFHAAVAKVDFLSVRIRH